MRGEGQRRARARDEARRGGTRGRRESAEAPLPLDAVDLLAGIAPGVQLEADDPPASLPDADEPNAAGITSVAAVGRMLRSDDATVRRLIRTDGIVPRAPDAAAPALEPERAGVPPRTPDKPGE
jgi:hypothetical protein